MSDSLIPSFLVSDVSESLRSLTKNDWPWAIRSGRSLKMSALLRKPMSEFPAPEVIDLFSYHWQHMSIRNKLFIYFAITNLSNFLCDYWIAVEVNWDINRLFKPCTLYIQWTSPSLHEAHPKPIEHSCTQAIPSSILSNLQYLNWLRYKQG